MLFLLWCAQKDDSGSSDEDDSVPFFSHLSPTATTTSPLEEKTASSAQPPSLAQETPTSEEGLAGYMFNSSHPSQGYANVGGPAQLSWYSGSHSYASYPDPASQYAPQHYQYSYQQGQSVYSYSQPGDTPVHIEEGVSAGSEPQLDNESVSWCSIS